MTPLEQHQIEIGQNLAHWRGKPLLQDIYAGFYRRILERVDRSRPGAIVEIGSGLGNLRQHLPGAICTDLFPNPWLQLACDGYELPFAKGSVSHLVLFDVFHHLRCPRAFLREADRVLTSWGKVLLFEPYISLISHPVYGLLHHEPVALGAAISDATAYPAPRDYYAAQGNATRLFFRREHPEWLEGWEIAHAEAFSAFAYLLSGGYSKPAFYPAALLPLFGEIDTVLSRFPEVFASRCLIELRRPT